MSSFSAEWLALREPADAAARAAALLAPLRLPCDRTLTIVDLATGTGANLRWLAPRLRGKQRWVVVDHETALLDTLSTRPAPAGVEVEPIALDLARELAAVPCSGADLVTASALLDLVSADWLRRLAERCVADRTAVLFALTYDGRIAWEPREDRDERVRDLVNLHQRRDKGFGPALGPAAAETAASAFRAFGYELLTAASDWNLGPESGALQQALVEGWCAAASEIAPNERDALEAWRRRRGEWIERGQSRLVVGHVDIAGRIG